MSRGVDLHRAPLRAARRMDEAAAVAGLLDDIHWPDALKHRVEVEAIRLVEGVRRGRRRVGTLDAFLREFGLDTREGVALMCLAEALLRVPDAQTADALIRDKIGDGDWSHHLGHADDMIVNASTWALMLSGRVVRGDGGEEGEGAGGLAAAWRRLTSRLGEPVIRQAMVQAMRILGRQFVLGRTIDEALERADEDERRGVRHSFDMLGEAARTSAQARAYHDTYRQAIEAIGQAARSRGWARGVQAGPGLSVKLSALHPRLEEAQRARVVAELRDSLVALAVAARQAEVGFTLDAEEADRLELQLDLVEALAEEPRLAGWDGLGFAVQAYQKRAPAVIAWAADLAQRGGRLLRIRLVKGAYWDSEIKRAQERGLAGYPVFTRKVNTDLSYLACAQDLLARRPHLHPMFATHNAHTVAAVRAFAREAGGSDAELFEFQRLHGMGEALYDQIAPQAPCRVYAPVGGHEELLGYLVRRLLENGANTSFVNRLHDDGVPVGEVVADPVARAAAHRRKAHPRIPAPPDLYAPERRNAAGIDLCDRDQLATLLAAMAEAGARNWRAGPLIDGPPIDAAMAAGQGRPVHAPADRRRIVGVVVEASGVDVGHAAAAARAAAPAWSATPAERRATILERAGALIEEHRAELMALLVEEGGKTIVDALSELREAVDYCRYYAARCRADFATPRRLPGPAGERDLLTLHGRGVFACISPWNFPLAIFVGQVAAALAAGNAVIAKPAEQTPLIAAQAVAMLVRAGVPADAVRLLPGDGRVGATLVADPRVDGVAFTGALDTARAINRTLAARAGAIVPLIAETGGLNVMIADSSALPEQLVDDVITSAFRSAGQRCSALRALFLPEPVAARVLAMLEGAARALVVGDPRLIATDVGPLIDAQAVAAVAAHAQRLDGQGRRLFQAPLPTGLEEGSFFPPSAYLLDSFDQLPGEVFGPVLHVIRYAPDRLDHVLDAVAESGYGLTLGIHSRIEATIARVRRHLAVGNTYVNRPMIGAVVGVQPFGGEGLSGTGPKAGGPFTLLRYAVERCVAVNTAAAGGDAGLVSLAEAEDETLDENQERDPS